MIAFLHTVNEFFSRWGGIVNAVALVLSTVGVCLFFFGSRLAQWWNTRSEQSRLNRRSKIMRNIEILRKFDETNAGRKAQEARRRFGWGIISVVWGGISLASTLFSIFDAYRSGKDIPNIYGLWLLSNVTFFFSGILDFWLCAKAIAWLYRPYRLYRIASYRFELERLGIPLTDS